MISSAVIIPDQVAHASTSPSPSLKRRQSSISEDSSKRPRLDTQGDPRSRDADDSRSPATPDSPSQRRRTSGLGAGVGIAEERKRGQRLFGALLGTLSQKSSRPVHRKRDEIEQRQRERVQKDLEEREEEHRRKRREIDQVRRSEQKVWDEQSMRIRHGNMHHTAHFLQTTTEPKLHYKPWDLRSQEKEQIQRQIEEVEASIQQELRDKGLNGNQDYDPSPNEQVANTKQESREGEIQSGETGDADVAMGSPPSRPDDPEVGKDKSPSLPPDATTLSKTGQTKDDDRGGEELVEGQEDDVMY